MKLGNLLKLAGGIIPLDTFEYLEFEKNTTNSQGQKVPSFKEAATKKGSVQSVDTVLFERLGLDTSKEYKMIYSSIDLKILESGKSSDRVIYDGKTYQALTKANWLTYNGWVGVVFVKI